MPNERQKRSERVRHEAGGAGELVAEDTSTKHKLDATSKRDHNVTSKATNDNSKQNRRVQIQRRNVTVFAESEQSYEPVTIMASANASEENELDDMPKQYRRRCVLSNWSRYEERPECDFDESTDYLVGEDFCTVLELQKCGVGSGGHLILRGEENWEFVKDERIPQLKNGLGALKVSDLVCSLSTLSFMKQMGIEESCIPMSLVQKYEELADNNRTLFNERRTNTQQSITELDKQLHRLYSLFPDLNLNITGKGNVDSSSVSPDHAKVSSNEYSDEQIMFCNNNKDYEAANANSIAYVDSLTISPNMVAIDISLSTISSENKLQDYSFSHSEFNVNEGNVQEEYDPFKSELLDEPENLTDLGKDTKKNIVCSTGNFTFNTNETIPIEYVTENKSSKDLLGTVEILVPAAAETKDLEDWLDSFLED